MANGAGSRALGRIEGVLESQGDSLAKLWAKVERMDARSAITLGAMLVTLVGVLAQLLVTLVTMKALPHP